MPTPPLGFPNKGLHGQRVPKRHRKLLKDNIYGITRRGGVVRIQHEIYHAARSVLKARLTEEREKEIKFSSAFETTKLTYDIFIQIIKNLTFVLGNSGDPNRDDGPLEGVHGKRRRTVTTKDVIFVLSRMGNPVYGFDPPYHGVRRHGAIVH
ncbi:uncharacterized protein Z519_05458 [Cladophialophora bantiana CBS 173.52]|uniref:Histone H4 n=1 Tax=Cladophialophora bantiana (strain ATCC 10958 / CBS 173.52 / CDC B-1940 / NIH 8579) TaxID=1442370 RepID=A0A0D2G6C3_CLAB1|nr:uncharacterized protein Z519_05458 [Cladophialophora bantiana CBS 173.52]KIW94142.1 hypothetical protein Z519_05458 [Cladophialophora bantiana CBS 173.52]